MTSSAPSLTAQHLTPPLRIITAAARFDGHDAAIHVLRRLLQDRGCEVIHLGHNRSVKELVKAAIQEDVNGLAISSYQGGHMGFFRFLLEQLKQAGAEHIEVFCGGGGTITTAEADALEQLGVCRVYSAGHHDDIGLPAIADQVINLCQKSVPQRDNTSNFNADLQLSQQLSRIEAGLSPTATPTGKPCPTIGITGTGGAGKSTLMDALLTKFLNANARYRFAVLAVDPSRQRSGGALLGDRIRINALSSSRVFFRSMATRRPDSSTNACLQQAIQHLQQSGFDLVFVETAGIGQSNAEIKALADLSIYVMTPEFGEAGQLEKIEMLDSADLVILNKADHTGSQDSLQQVRRQWRYNHQGLNNQDPGDRVFACTANAINDDGVSALFRSLCQSLPALALPTSTQDNHYSSNRAITPAHCLGNITTCLKHHKKKQAQRIQAAGQAYQLFQSLQAIGESQLPEPLSLYQEEQLNDSRDSTLQKMRQRYNEVLSALTSDDLKQLKDWPQKQKAIQQKHYHYQVRGIRHQGDNYTLSLADLPIAKLVMPTTPDWGEQLRFLLNENLPGHFPFTAGVFPYRREHEMPTRMFAGEGSPEQTNQRFHYLSQNQPSIRLSTAFDPVTLYGEDPSKEPDTLGRVGMSGVSIATLDDMKVLYSGLDLNSPKTSVSLTINGPAPILLAQFLHTAIDQAVEKHLKANQQLPHQKQQPHYQGLLPATHSGSGLALLGCYGAELLPQEDYERIRHQVLSNIRGTLQADILKEDQAQNECIFDLEFALKLMGDVQLWCHQQRVNNFYTVSVSGYHMAEAGANPVTQLAFTLANGFTLLEYFIAQGLESSQVASQMSFFFSNAMDPEYAVIGRVARRIWARALKYYYHSDEQAQRFKYHIQTSGRSLQSRDIDLNDVRTTLEALYATLDNCNSLHTNAFDEAITTPTEGSVRRALGIQAILQQEFGLSLNQNTLQGSYFIEQLTDAVEEAVYELFTQLDERGGVFGAMETGFQRTRIQQESMEYERRKQQGTLPIIGVNCFQSESDATSNTAELTRIDETSQRLRVRTVEQFKARHANKAPAALAQLKVAVGRGDNAFAALMEAVPYCTLGQLTHALYEVGGHYRQRL